MLSDPMEGHTAKAFDGALTKLRLHAVGMGGLVIDQVSTAVRALLDADALPGPLAVRGPQAGDRLRIHAVGTRKLHDVLIDRKVPRSQRRALPVLVAGDVVLWVPGVVRSAAARVADGTRRVLRARWWSDDKVALPLQNPCGNLTPRVECTERGSIE